MPRSAMQPHGCQHECRIIVIRFLIFTAGYASALQFPLVPVTKDTILQEDNKQGPFWSLVPEAVRTEQLLLYVVLYQRVSAPLANLGVGCGWRGSHTFSGHHYLLPDPQFCTPPASLTTHLSYSILEAGAGGTQSRSEGNLSWYLRTGLLQMTNTWCHIMPR